MGKDDRLRRLKRGLLLVMLAWSIVVGLSLAFSIYQHQKAFYSELYTQAKGMYVVDRSYRDWAIRSGGIYVPITKETPPNPYMKNVPERDITTPSGRRLTLLNSSYMTRQVHGLMDRKEGTVRAHIASLRPINPLNRADAWERKALRTFEQGKQEASGMDRMADGKTYFRYMQPMITEQACLKCHAEYGDKVGDIRGGISVSIPVDAPLSAENKETAVLLSGHGIIWLLGLVGLYAGGRRQKRAMLEVEQSEAEVRLVTNSIAHAIYGQDLNHRCTFANEACVKLLGYDNESELLGQDMHALMHHTRADGSPYPADECPTHRSLQKKQNLHVDEEWLWRKDGSSFPVEYWSYPIMLEGNLHGTVVTFLDISEMKKMERELHLSRQLLDSIVEHLPAMVFLKEAKELRFELFNRAGEEMLGYARSDLLGRNDHDFFPKEQADFFTRNDRAVLDSRKSLEIPEEPIKTADGRKLWLHTFKIGLYDANNQPTHLLGISIDITQRKQMEERLAQIRYNLAEAQRIAHIGSWELDLASNKLTWSDEIYRIFELDPEGFAPSYEAFLEGIHPEDREMVNKAYGDALKDKTPYDIEHRLLLPDGRIKYVREQCETNYDEDGKALRSIGTVQDISELKRGEIALQHAIRAQKALSTVNRELVHATDETLLLQAICRAIVDQKEYHLAWVGYVQHDEACSIRLVASAGDEHGVLERVRPSWGNDEFGTGPSGRAVRTGKTQVVMDISRDPEYQPWKDDLAKHGCVSSLALPLRNGGVFGILHVYAGVVDAFTAGEIALLEEMAADLAFGVSTLRMRLERDRALNQIESHSAQLHDNLQETIVAISKAVEARDPYTSGHQRRVADLACAIAKQMGLDIDRIEGIRMGATIHDIGKIHVPAEILAKPFQLSKTEYLIIKEHPKIGYGILKDIHFPWPVADIAHQHHERLDGSGYPQGLKGDAICLEARIVSVADVVEAISSHRPYRAALGMDAAIDEIRSGKGTLYDAAVADACLKILAEGFAFG